MSGQDCAPGSASGLAAALPHIAPTLPPALVAHIQAPLPMRLLAAQGVLPLPPCQLVCVQAALCQDAEQRVVQAANQALCAYPAALFAQAVADTDNAAVLAQLLTAIPPTQPDKQRALCAHRHTPDTAVAACVRRCCAQLAADCAADQQRLLRCQAFACALLDRGDLPAAQRDKLCDLLVRNGVVLAQYDAFAQALARLSPAQAQHLAQSAQQPADNAPPPAAQPSRDDPGAARMRAPLTKRLAQMAPAQKVALALRGDREARGLLLRDTNRVICTAAIKNPRITAQEVLMAAQNRALHEDVLRIIAQSKEMSRAYAVKLALVSNPKTPVNCALRLLGVLRKHDIKQIAGSKQVAAAVAQAARRMSQHPGRSDR